MIQLDSKDAALLAMIAQYQGAPKDLTDRFYADLSNSAKPIGQELLNPKRRQRQEIKLAAFRLREWAKSNRKTRNLSVNK